MKVKKKSIKYDFKTNSGKDVFIKLDFDTLETDAYITLNFELDKKNLDDECEAWEISEDQELIYILQTINILIESAIEISSRLNISTEKFMSDMFRKLSDDIVRGFFKTTEEIFPLESFVESFSLEDLYGPMGRPKESPKLPPKDVLERIERIIKDGSWSMKEHEEHEEDKLGEKDD